MRLLVVMLTCNQLDLTEAVMNDIHREKQYFDGELDVVIVDNGGDYEYHYDEIVVKPGENLRWVKGVNLAIDLYMNDSYDGIVCLNDDIRLSNGFFTGLYDSVVHTNAGLVAPMYDDVYEHQKNGYTGSARNYVPRKKDHVCQFVDGTAFYFPKNIWKEVGVLDAEHFGKYGWGSDIDFAYRVRKAGYSVVVTERAFINHFHQGSAKFVEKDWSGKAGVEMEEGMTAKYGLKWRSIVY